jgi:hypothetical protein
MSSQNQETTPDQLLESFRGRSLKSIILFTIVVHLVIVGATSVPYLMKSLGGKSDSKLTEEERTEIASREANAALRDIATKHGIKPQDLSSRIADGAPPKSNTTPTPAANEETDTPAPEEEDKPKSAIEEELEVKENGPKVPSIPTEEVEDDELFK